MSDAPFEPLGKDPRLKRYTSLVEMIGDAENPTPIVALTRLAPEGTEVFVKVEWVNPFGSSKDRPAKWLLDGLAQRGELGEGRTVIEPTSGNTGIALAGLCGQMGRPMIAIVPSSMPDEKSAILRALGAEVIPTPDRPLHHRHPMDIAMDVALEMMEEDPNLVMPNQYDNLDNGQSHYETTGPEIWAQTEGKIDYFFCGTGTGGTISGAGRYLKEQNPSVKVIGIEPVCGHHISGLKNMEETAVPGNLDRNVIDETVMVDDEMTREVAREVHAKEGLLVGSSGAACLAGALKWLTENNARGIAVTFAPDSSQKASSYLNWMLAEK
jgi:S-sulfo-L-cysteine synthase (O-acetyl-L-serine-dependent)